MSTWQGRVSLGSSPGPAPCLPRWLRDGSGRGGGVGGIAGVVVPAAATAWLGSLAEEQMGPACPQCWRSTLLSLLATGKPPASPCLAAGRCAQGYGALTWLPRVGDLLIPRAGNLLLPSEHVWHQRRETRESMLSPHLTKPN